MNTTETYQSLVTSQHRKQKFLALVGISGSFYSRIQFVLNSLQTKFDVDYAVGNQLDIIGLWVGVSRFIRSPITGIYFEWGSTASVGWSNGIWQGEFSPTSGLTSLPDDIYRTLIRAKIAANSWNGTIDGAYDIWETIFTNNIIVIQDNQDMSIVIAIVGETVDSLTTALITGGYIQLKPEGVKVDYYAIPVDTNPVFVWGSEGTVDGVAGWGSGSWASLVLPT